MLYDSFQTRFYRGLIAALDSDLPVIVTEFGTWDSNDETFDNISPYLDAFTSILDEHDTGFVTWIFENSLQSDCYKTKDWTEDDLTPYGIWYRNCCRKAAGLD